MLFVGLRHDVDNTYGLRKGLPKVINIERRHDVKSTIFVRIDIFHSERDYKFLRSIFYEGWEIGLHLINTVNDPSLISPSEELKILREIVGTNVHGVTPCGKTIGFKGDITWMVMDSLGLEYMEGYGSPNFNVKTFIIPTHLSFDIYYVRNYGEENGYRKFKEDLMRKLDNKGVATVLTHPEWFVRSVGGRGLIKIPLTILGVKMMNKVYEKFLSEFKDKVLFLRYVDLYRLFKEGKR
ncbi:MAG: hypothetical protein QXT67_09135 [Candidatus Bathyarchaeia archaeon]